MIVWRVPAVDDWDDDLAGDFSVLEPEHPLRVGVVLLRLGRELVSGEWDLNDSSST